MRSQLRTEPTRTSETPLLPWLQKQDTVTALKTAGIGRGLQRRAHQRQTRSSPSRQLVTIVKILFSLITIIIPRKLYKVHSMIKSGGDGERKPVWPGSIVSRLQQRKPSWAGELGGGGPIVKNKHGSLKKKKTRPPIRKQGERACSWAEGEGEARRRLRLRLRGLALRRAPSGRGAGFYA